MLDKLYPDIWRSILRFFHYYDLYFLPQVSKSFRKLVSIYLLKCNIPKALTYSNLINNLCEHTIRNNYSKLLAKCIKMKLVIPMNDRTLHSFYHNLSAWICGMRGSNGNIYMGVHENPLSIYNMEYTRNKLSDPIIRKIWNIIPIECKIYSEFSYRLAFRCKHFEVIINFLLYINIPYSAYIAYSICNYAVEYGFWDIYDLFYQKSTEYKCRRYMQKRYHRMKNAYMKGHEDVIYEIYKRNHPLPQWAISYINTSNVHVKKNNT